MPPKEKTWPANVREGEKKGEDWYEIVYTTRYRLLTEYRAGEELTVDKVKALCKGKRFRGGPLVLTDEEAQKLIDDMPQIEEEWGHRTAGLPTLEE